MSSRFLKGAERDPSNMALGDHLRELRKRMFICLGVWTPDEITLPEAFLTFMFFFALILIAYGADKFRERSLAK